MKSPSATKIPPRVHHVAPPGTPPIPLGSVRDHDPTFFAHLMKTAGITQKDVMFCLRVNKTTANAWYTGKKRDPLGRASDVREMLALKKRTDLIAAALAYIAGEHYDSAVLLRITELLRETPNSKTSS